MYKRPCRRCQGKRFCELRYIGMFPRGIYCDRCWRQQSKVSGLSTGVQKRLASDSRWVQFPVGPLGGELKAWYRVPNSRSAA